MKAWDVGLCDCGRNLIMFVWACCMPYGLACMQAFDAKLTDDDPNAALIAGVLQCCLGSIGGIINRYNLRQKLNIESSLCADCWIWCCLGSCGGTQEYIQTVKEKKGDEKFLIWKF